MLEPLGQWYCDECGEVIASPQAGCVEWEVDNEGRGWGFRILHHCTASPRPRGCGFYGNHHTPTCQTSWVLKARRRC
jgi:hypothetical protein